MKLRGGVDGNKGHFCIGRYNENEDCWEYYNFGKWCSSRGTTAALVGQIFFTEEHAAIVMKKLVDEQRIAEGRVLTCVYCGTEYPQDTPASGDQVLTNHIRSCPKHPLRTAEDKINQLRVLIERHIASLSEWYQKIEAGGHLLTVDTEVIPLCPYKLVSRHRDNEEPRYAVAEIATGKVVWSSSEEQQNH
jgi:hypothetical protein